jgi:hypothetical protein
MNLIFSHPNGFVARGADERGINNCLKMVINKKFIQIKLFLIKEVAMSDKEVLEDSSSKKER